MTRWLILAAKIALWFVGCYVLFWVLCGVLMGAIMWLVGYCAQHPQ